MCDATQPMTGGATLATPRPVTRSVPHPATRIKCCGMFREEDITAVNAARPDMVGFVVDFPRSHRSVSPERLAELAPLVEPGITRVGVFVGEPVEQVAALVAAGLLDAVQLHGHEDEAYLAELRAQLGVATHASSSDGLREEGHASQAMKEREVAVSIDAQTAGACGQTAENPVATRTPLIIQAFRIRTAEDVARAEASSADLVLLDNGQGTGESFDWSLVQGVGRPFILAGGLGPANVAQAIAAVHPWAVDMSSGLETNKLKDPAKIAAAVAVVRGA